MNVILLGAGASKAYTESDTGQRMPLATDFFTTYRKLDIYNDPWVIRGQLLNYIRTKYGVDPEEYLSGEIDIEEIHSEIEAKLLDTIKDDSNPDRIIFHATFTELSSIFACVVNTIAKGGASSAHKLLAQRLSPNDVIITFNWDTLMDRALESETNWTTDRGYCFRPNKIFRNGWQAPSTTDRKAPKLLKLHGSANWLTSYSMVDGGDLSLTQVSSPDTVWVVEDATEPYNCYAGRFMPGDGRMSFGYYPPNIRDDAGQSAPEDYVFVQARPKHPQMPEGTSGSEGLVSMPLIIPPVRNKRYYIYGTLFTGLWSDAQNALAEADRIIVIGYSFPQTDLKSLDLFKQAFISRDTIPEVVILDPFPQRVAEIFERTLGIPSSSLTILPEYFTDNYDFTKLKL